MTVDAVLLRRKLVLIAPDLTLIAQQIHPAQIADHDEHIRELVLERLIERVVGRVVDINFHVVTASGEPPPRDYYSSFALAAKAGAIAFELAAALAPLAGLRNRIAHEYDAIDPAKVKASIEHALPALIDYVRQIEAFVERVAS